MSKSSKFPKYVEVWNAISKNGTATNAVLAAQCGLTKLQVTGSLIQLERMGAIKRASRGVWATVVVPVPKPRGRPASEESVRGRVLKQLVEENEASLHDLVEALSDESEDVDKVRGRVAHALVGLRKENIVEVLGSRGTYRYALVKKQGVAA